MADIDNAHPSGSQVKDKMKLWWIVLGVVPHPYPKDIVVVDLDLVSPIRTLDPLHTENTTR
ncbi:MAG: hypothetical protein GY906_37960 [bacterium]|nr:hypothetical protein [bacterium]